MSLRSDHKALIFIGIVGILGASVRVVRAASGEQAPAVQPALERQARVADSAAAAQRRIKSARAARGNAPRSGDRRVRGTNGRGAPSTTTTTSTPPLDRPGYIGGKLDLDVATAAQIDSLPGITPLMAKRIAVDRVRRGPFLSLAGLQRVSGAGRQFLRKIDTLVTFSGTVTFPSAGDTTLPSRRPRR